jgi:microcompartment protein CcmK/EutM
MVLGKVIGSVWATRKDEKLQSMKFLIVRYLDFNLKFKDTFVVAADAVGAGAGEIVLVASGSSARMTEITHQKPVDAVIMAIVDKLDIEPDWNKV